MLKIYYFEVYRKGDPFCCIHFYFPCLFHIWDMHMKLNYPEIYIKITLVSAQQILMLLRNILQFQYDGTYFKALMPLINHLVISHVILFDYTKENRSHHIISNKLHVRTLIYIINFFKIIMHRKLLGPFSFDSNPLRKIKMHK